MSSLTWLAHSEAERKRTLDVIKLLDEPGTLDEIGIGGIRDAFAELLFPGTSTIQTRARYFLFVPWAYRNLEGKAPVNDAAGQARRQEVKLIDALMDSEDTQGVIGRDARARLQRLPSAVYWQGLETWGIRRAATSIRAYHRRLESTHFGVSSKGEAGEASGLPSAWHAELPEPPEEFPDHADLALRAEEASYLRDRIMTRCPDTLLAVLVSRQARSSALPKAAWELEEGDIAMASETVREQIEHARVFSDLIHGAQLLYNLMLAQASRRDGETELYGDRLDLWADRVVAEGAVIAAWNENRQRFWEIVREGNPRLRARAQAFVDKWLDLVGTGDPHRLATDRRARETIAERERMLKGRLARLVNPTALDAWKGASGSEPLFFRWPQARTLVEDIAAPLVDADESVVGSADPV